MSHHDIYVYKFLGNKKNAKQFFSFYAPLKLREQLHISSLERDQTRLVDNEMQDSHTDRLFVFSHKTLNRKIFTLIEHKSGVRRDVFQQLRKQLNAAEDEYPEHLIIPIIFYHGLENWTLKDSYHENKKLVPSKARPLASRHALNFTPIIINARKLPPLPPEASVSIRSFHQAITRYNEDDPQNSVHEIVLMFKNAPEKLHELRNFTILIKYVSNVYKFKFKIMAEQIGPEIPEKFRKLIMTAATRLKLEGREEGRLEGIQSIAHKMLQMGRAEEETIKITGLTHEQLVEAGILFG